MHDQSICAVNTEGNISLATKEFLNFFKRMSFGFGQEEIDEEDAHKSAAHEEPEGPVFPQCNLHVRECTHYYESA